MYSRNANSYWNYNITLSAFSLLLVLNFFYPRFASGTEPTTTKVAPKPKLVYEDKNIKIRIITRSPKQIAAFYEGREFSQEAIKETTKYCFPAIIVINKTADTLWLDLKDWQFLSSGAPFKRIQRIQRSYWKKRWREIQLSTAHQSTFGWTLMPDARDLRKDEGVGGNIPIEMQYTPYTLIARFKTGQTKQGPIISVSIPEITCPNDDETE